ncbi:MAG: hypothetical protein KC425_25150, partial [Anaerolineales bacterium]|nr:hypothetical protein [Anaerolineales bacterium]
MTEEQLTIRLLGGVSLTKGERPITTLPTRKAEALLIYLVSHKRPFAREVLAELLWDDRPQDQALANLRSILSSLRRALKPYLLITRQTVGFNHDSNYWLDTAAFLHEIGDWRLEIGQSPDLAAAGPHLQSLINAAALYQGAFLQGFYLRESRGFEEWATLERERLQRQAILALRQLADAYQAAGQPELALLAVDRLLGLDPLSELAHQQKMLLLARSGQAQAALAHFQACAALLDAELGVAPAP